jgi:exodeoxyribonuclease-5
MLIYPSINTVEKAFSDGLLSQDVYDSTMRCLQSANPNDIIFSGMIVRQDLCKHLQKNLNDEQKRIMNAMLDYILSPHDEDCKGVLLNGSAGTGKTTTMSKIIYAVSILCPKEDICVNAPTHKAIKVLEKKCENVGHNVYFGTTHHMLGLAVSYTPDGKLKFRKVSNEEEYSLMIIDEVSMIEEELCNIILTSKAFRKTKLVFMGDVKQLPPVNTKEAYLFEKANELRIQQMNLTEIVRQVAGNPIVKMTKMVADNINEKVLMRVSQDVVNGDGVIIRPKDKLQSIIQYWFSQLEAISNPDFIKILAWTNRQVNECNVMARDILLQNPSKPFIKGDRIIANEQIMIDGEIVADNSDEFNVIDCRIVKKKKVIPFTKNSITLEFYKIKTKELKDDIYVITKNSKDIYEKYLEDVKQYCIRKHDQKLWPMYYAMRNWSARINYSYATTIHKSQGSTYENVIVIMDDIDKNRNIYELNKLCYTAYTRARKKLILIA